MTDLPLDGVCLLLADDEPVPGPMLADLFEDHGADVVGPWVTGRTAVDAPKASTPSAALLDVTLRDGDTYALASALQPTGAPYAFLSASGPDDVPARLTPFAFLQKPASCRNLVPSSTA